MRGSEIPGLGPILSRFCRDRGLSRDYSPNSGSYRPLRGHTHHAVTVDALESEQCAVVTCQHDGVIMGTVSVVGNDDGMGGKTTLECIYTNNDDQAAPIECK
jgi:hypothetical protein